VFRKGSKFIIIIIFAKVVGEDKVDVSSGTKCSNIVCINFVIKMSSYRTVCIFSSVFSSSSSKNYTGCLQLLEILEISLNLMVLLEIFV